ncbi:MAG: hypothetical protein AVO35_12455 [Candidatus Aegiribacteria sp. MLS_C]|nr:MAG: hypothetical protein AVO35_12455 [Candidatus Aegiribacteria sp. MLS_C]
MLDDLDALIDEQRQYLGPLSRDLRYDIASPHGVEHYVTGEIDRPREVATIEQVVSKYSRKAPVSSLLLQRLSISII